MIRDATEDDLPEIVALAARRRREYEAAQPRFWRESADALDRHQSWLAGQVGSAECVALVAHRQVFAGFLLASIVEAPPAYDPGGLTAVVDDFAVVDPKLWATVGRELLTAAQARLMLRDVVQMVVVCGRHDRAKRAGLLAAGLTVASEWFVGGLPLS